MRSSTVSMGKLAVAGGVSADGEFAPSRKSTAGNSSAPALLPVSTVASPCCSAISSSAAMEASSSGLGAPKPSSKTKVGSSGGVAGPGLSVMSSIGATCLRPSSKDASTSRSCISGSSSISSISDAPSSCRDGTSSAGRKVRAAADFVATVGKPGPVERLVSNALCTSSDLSSRVFALRSSSRARPSMTWPMHRIGKAPNRSVTKLHVSLMLADR
mmetsp:Transcript_54201/g.96907  ORF Transcript_54201/g.96907 Transcript_54201/m.96907 type:complete len:215 (-) Transcript_54201:211-855(-)